MIPTADPAAVCDFCGLPLPRGWWSASPAGAVGEKAYCCFGCRFAAAITQEKGGAGAAQWTLTCLGLSVFLTMNVLVFSMALWTQDLYGDPEGSGPLSTALRGLFRYLCLLLSLPVLLLLGGPLLENSWENLRRGLINTDLLLVIGVAAAYLYSTLSVVREQGPVYFEVGCVVLVLVTLGRWLEARGKLEATAAIASLQQLLPERARLLRDTKETWVPLGEIQPGDCLRVLAGERIPCDGQVVRHCAAVDEQVVTGESQPCIKEPGDRLFGGSLDLDGDLILRMTAADHQGVLRRMIELAQQARLAKGRLERLADRITAWFLPVVLVIAVAAFLGHAGGRGLPEGIFAGLAVLLIACPCALGLATPMAVWAALGQAALARVLFRNSEALETLASVKAVRLDKTGTVTTGTSAVADLFLAPSADRGTVLALAHRLTLSSDHIHAQGIRRFAHEHSADLPVELLAHVRTVPGRGVIGKLGGSGEQVYLGSARFMVEQGLLLDAALQAATRVADDAGLPLSCIGWDGAVRGIFLFREELRPEAAEALRLLRKKGLDVAILTGDRAARGSALGQGLGVAVIADLLPEDKVTTLREARERCGLVAMVGDGLNDAPALAASDVGIAMGCGADVSRDSADVCLLGNDLLRLPWAFDLARRTMSIIRQNLFWAFFYNLIGIGLACSGHLNPVLAALAMVLSSFLVVTNSLRLRGEPPQAVKESEPLPCSPERGEVTADSTRETAAVSGGQDQP